MLSSVSISKFELISKMSGTIRSCWRCPDTVAVRLRDTVFEAITFEKILSIRVLELFLILAGSTI